MHFNGFYPKKYTSKKYTYFLVLSGILHWTFGTQLLSQNPIPDLGSVFQVGLVPRINIFLPADSLAWLLDEDNNQNDEHVQATFIFSDGTVLDTVQQIGFRIRGNTSRSSQKKSWKISFNTFEQGRKWMGLEKMNVNGEHNDPTISRSVLGWNILRELELPASRANHVQLYINNAYFGLYANVEHVDEIFVKLRYGNNDGNLYKCLWPAGLDYLGQNPNLYAQLNSNGRPAYELLTNTAQPDFTDLAQFIDALNNSSVGNLPCALEPIFNVDAFLKTYAFEVLLGHWDNYAYNQNNYYLYKNTATGKFEYIPYDLDNSLGIDWLNKDWTNRDVYDWARYPLCKRLLQVPRYRERFSFYLNDMLQTVFYDSNLFPQMDALQAKIRPYAAIDTFRTKDYGFTMADYDKNFSMGLPAFSHTKWGIKEFLEVRSAATFAQLDALIERPLVQNTLPHEVTQWTEFGFKIAFTHAAALDSVRLALPGGNANGGTLFLTLFDDGIHNDGLAQDGTYGIRLSDVHATVKTIPYYLQIFEKNGALGRFPLCGFDSIHVLASQNKVFINEIMAKNSTSLTDAFGEYDDWIELYIPSGTNISTENLYLTDNENTPDKWPLPTLTASGYLLFWADGQEDQGPQHCNFKLSGSGEYIGLFEKKPDGTFLRHDGFSFGNQEDDIAFARLPNGRGPLNEAAPTPLASNQRLVLNNEAQTSQAMLSIFPNPSTGIVQVSLLNQNYSSEVLLVRNSFGQIVQQDLNFNGNSKLDLTDLPDGLYSVELKQSGVLVRVAKIRG